MIQLYIWVYMPINMLYESWMTRIDAGYCAHESAICSLRASIELARNIWRDISAHIETYEQTRRFKGLSRRLPASFTRIRKSVDVESPSATLTHIQAINRTRREREYTFCITLAIRRGEGGNSFSGCSCVFPYRTSVCVCVCVLLIYKNNEIDEVINQKCCLLPSSELYRLSFKSSIPVAHQVHHRIHPRKLLCKVSHVRASLYLIRRTSCCAICIAHHKVGGAGFWFYTL